MAPEFNMQPHHLQGEYVTLRPLQPGDFEILYAVASDPAIWEQHPNKDRYKREVFEVYFEGALKSKGAFLILDAKTAEAIGSTRFYDHDPVTKKILVGYTFLARTCWGGKHNQEMKKLMMDHAFHFVNHVQFHVGATNFRSQTAMQRLGAKKVGEIDLAYYGESSHHNFVFEVERTDWVYSSVINHF